MRLFLSILFAGILISAQAQTNTPHYVQQASQYFVSNAVYVASSNLQVQVNTVSGRVSIAESALTYRPTYTETTGIVSSATNGLLKSGDKANALTVTNLASSVMTLTNGIAIQGGYWTNGVPSLVLIYTNVQYFISLE